MTSESPSWQLAISSLSLRPTAELVSTLVVALRDPATGEVPRQAIAEALGSTANPQAIQSLHLAAADADDTLRGLAAIGLGKFPSPESVRQLIELLADQANTVRNLAERSLLQMPFEVREFGVELLLRYLDHPVPLTRSPAARLLGLTQDPRALDPLVNLLGRDKQWLVRMWAAKGLGDLGSHAAFDALSDRLKHDEKNRVRAAAAEAIGKLYHPQAEIVLKAALSDEDGGVQKHAEESLAKLRRSHMGHDEPQEHHEPHFEDE